MDVAAVSQYTAVEIFSEKTKLEEKSPKIEASATAQGFDLPRKYVDIRLWEIPTKHKHREDVNVKPKA